MLRIESGERADRVERRPHGLGGQERTVVGRAQHHEPVHARAGALFERGAADQAAHAVRDEMDFLRQASKVFR